MQYILSNDHIKLTVDTLGAEVVSVCVNGKERQWQNGNGTWSGHAPVLFPFCGNCSMIVDGILYRQPRHGFARKSQFELSMQDSSKLSFVLKSNESTKTIYPFDFIFTVEYALNEKGYLVSYKVYNPSENDIFFSCGGHESFALEDSLSSYCIDFELEEDIYYSKHNNEGQLTGEKIHVGKTRSLILDENFFSNSYTGIIEDIKSKVLVLRNIKTCKNQVKISLFDKNYLLLWRPEDAKMICVEPWLNLPDKVGEDNKEFSSKTGVLKVEQGESVCLTRSFEYFD